MKYSLALISAAALALVNAADDCVSTCEQTAADSLGCDLSDVAGCICQSTFATKAKACLYETDGCGAAYVSQMYESVNSLCADSTGSATTTSAAATATGGSDDCIASCEATAASSLGCDVSDLAGCFCLADFATAAKACLYQNSCSSDVAGFYSEYNSACAAVSEASSAPATSAPATSEPAATAEPTSAAPTAGETTVAPVSSAQGEPSETTAAGTAPTSLATSTTVAASNGTSVTSSPTGFVTAGASGLREGGVAFAAAVAIGGGLAALM